MGQRLLRPPWRLPINLAAACWRGRGLQEGKGGGVDQGLPGPRHLSGLSFLICQIRSLTATADGYWWSAICVHAWHIMVRSGTGLSSLCRPIAPLSPPYSQPPGFPPPSLLLTQALPPTSFCWSESPTPPLQSQLQTCTPQSPQTSQLPPCLTAVCLFPRAADLCPFPRAFTPLSPSDVEPPHALVSLERNKWFFFDEERSWDSERTQLGNGSLWPWDPRALWSLHCAPLHCHPLGAISVA